MKEYRRFFELLTEFKPYDWQIEVAKKIIEVSDGGGLILVRAETGGGKTEAATLPGLYLGKQVLVVEPYRALIEDMVIRFRKYLSRLSSLLDVPYALGVDYGGRHYIYECRKGRCSDKETVTKKPFGADVIVTTMDEMVYRLLSIGTPRKASIYTSLVRTGKPVVFFDEAHVYSTEVANPLVTLVHLVASLSLYTPVVLASATLPDAVREHLKLVAERNGVVIHEVIAPQKQRSRSKATVELDMKKPGDAKELVSRITQHVNKLISKGYKSILVRVVTPEVAYSVYSSLTGITKNGYGLGILHGRMPIFDRERVFKAVKEDVEGKRNVVLVATSVIEAGVDLDFDAGVLELTPCRSLEQTMGRINRKYEKDSEVIVVDTLDEAWKLLEEEGYLDEARRRLSVFTALGKPKWEDISPTLKKLDEKYTVQKLSTPNLVDAYSSSYSKMLAVSLYSLFHLEGTFLEHLLALSKKEYETRGVVDVLAEVEGEPRNYLRVPLNIAEKLAENYGVNVWETRKVPKNLLIDHSYVKTNQRIEARGLIV